MSKPGRPNLSLAGKRETPTQQKQARGGGASNNRGAGRGRGGRGRGGGGPRPRQELIQTGGVFSEGLGDFPTKKKDKEIDKEQFAYTKREKGSGGPSTSDEKNAEEKEKVNLEGKASFKGWDELWRSDDEGDEQELKSLIPRTFISDLRRGNVMPVVLPVDAQKQFLDVINKSARLSLEEDDDQFDVEEKKPLEAAAKSKPTKMSAEQLILMLENSTTDLLHLQLPSVVGSICNTMEANVEAPMEVDDPDEEIPTGVPMAPAPPSGLPQSRKIGKLQVTNKGRLVLKVGGHSIDITTKPTSGKQQGTVLLEVDPSADQLQAPSPFAQQSTIQNSLYHLGNVKHNLVGSMTWEELREKNEESEEGTKVNEVTMEDNDATVGEDDRKKIELLELEQAKWATLAARWATGLPSS